MAEIDYKKVITDYREALRALYGNKIADKSNIYYSGGWIYINLAQRFPDGSIGAVGIADSIRVFGKQAIAKVKSIKAYNPNLLSKRDGTGRPKKSLAEY